MAPSVLLLDDLGGKPENFVAIILVESLGDVIACEPVIGYVKKTYPDQPVIWVTSHKYAEVFISHPALDYLVLTDSIYAASKWAENVSAPNVVINLHLCERYCPVTKKTARNHNDPFITMRNYLDFGPLLQVFCQSARIPPLHDAPKFYTAPEFSAPPLPSPYIVVHCKSSNAARDWQPEKWRHLYEFFARDSIYTVEIGMERIMPPSVDSPYYVDMTREHSLQKIARIISRAHFFFGLDSAFAHLANALTAHGLVIMGKYLQWRHYVPYTGLYREGHIVRNPELAPY